jgi:hypothetical protein
MAGRLVMSGDISDWLRELAADEPARARAVGAALVAVLDAPDPASAPCVNSLAESAAPAGPESLDDLYQEALNALRVVRQEVANAATARSSIGQAIEALADVTDYGDVQARLARLREHMEAITRREEAATALSQRLQAQIDDFRTRKECVKASYTAAVGVLKVRRAISESPLSEINEAQSAVAAAEASVREAVRFGQALVVLAGGGRPAATGLFELQAGGYGDDEVRLMLAEHPPGTTLLLAVLHGSEAIESHRAEAIGLASDLLADLRAGPPDEPDDSPMIEFDSASAFARAFFPETDAAVRAGAGELAARMTLFQLRERIGISEQDMAGRMQMTPAQLRDFEQTSLADHQPAQLSRYISVLGGDIGHVALINGERFDLR